MLYTLPRTYVYGVATDDVVSVSVSIDGEVVPATVANNSYFAEIAGADLDAVDSISAELADGTIQVFEPNRPKSS